MKAWDWIRRRSRTTAESMVADRTLLRSGKTVHVTAESAQRNGAVWACLRLRADLISSMRVGCYRNLDGIQLSVPIPKVIKTPGALYVGGKPVSASVWIYATQRDLDLCGNSFGVVMERSKIGTPARIDLVPISSVVVKMVNGELQYWIDNIKYSPDDIHHEMQFVQSGLPVGLSPIAHASLSLGEYSTAQDLALSWFTGSAVPLAHLRNTSKAIPLTEARKAKDHFRTSIQSGDLFVTGSDWEFKPIQAISSQNEYLETRKFGISDIARFFGVPSDLIEAAVSGSNITYASLAQRNMQFLIMNLGPAVLRREESLGALVPRPNYVQLDRSSLLAMDPASRAATNSVKIESCVLTPDEARAMDGLPPLTEDQMVQIERLVRRSGKSGNANGSTA